MRVEHLVPRAALVSDLNGLAVSALAQVRAAIPDSGRRGRHGGSRRTSYGSAINCTLSQDVQSTSAVSTAGCPAAGNSGKLVRRRGRGKTLLKTRGVTT